MKMVLLVILLFFFGGDNIFAQPASAWLPREKQAVLAHFKQLTFKTEMYDAITPVMKFLSSKDTSACTEQVAAILRATLNNMFSSADTMLAAWRDAEAGAKTPARRKILKELFNPATLEVLASAGKKLAKQETLVVRP